MKIAIFCSSTNIVPPPKTGGTEQPTFYLARGLAQRGHEVVLFAAKGSKIPGVQVREISPFAVCIKKEYLNIQERIAHFYDSMALVDFFKNEADEYDVIQFNGYVFHDVLPFAKLSKTPVVVRINYPHHLVYPYIKKHLDFDNVTYLPISHFVKSVMPDLRYVDPIYPAIDFNEFKFSNRPKKNFLFVGRICWNKGTHLAIEAIKKTKNKLVIAGRIDEQPPYEYFKKHIEPNIDGKIIKYIGEVGFKEKIKLYQNALATLCPIQWDEPFGNVMIESMACGTPVIAFDRASVPEIVEHGKNGFVVKNIDEMAGSFGKIEKLDRRRVRLLAQKKYDLEQYVSKHEKMYQKLIHD